MPGALLNGWLVSMQRTSARHSWRASLLPPPANSMEPRVQLKTSLRQVRVCSTKQLAVHFCLCRNFTALQRPPDLWERLRTCRSQGSLKTKEECRNQEIICKSMIVPVHCMHFALRMELTCGG